MSIYSSKDQYKDLKQYLDESKVDTVQIEYQQFLDAGSKLYLIILGNIIIGLLSLVLLWGSVPDTILVGWIVLLCISILMRTLQLLKYQKVEMKRLARWKGYFIISSFFSGVIWGIGGLLIEIYMEEMHHGLEVFILGGMSVAAIPTNTPIRWNYPAFMVPMLSIVTIYFFLQNDLSHLFLAIMTISFMIIMGIFSMNFRQLQFEKEILISLAKHALDQFHNSEQRLKDIASSMGEGFFVVDEHGKLLMINPEGERLLGWSFDELKKIDMHSEVHHHVADASKECLVKKSYLYGESCHSEDDLFKRKNGEIFPVSLTAAPVHTEEGQRGAVILFRDITIQKEMQKKLTDLALHDALTGLYNRGSFDEKLKEEINRSQRYDRNISLLLIDIDFFKKVNDTYGHQAGDEVLKSIAGMISDSVRNSDYVARYGGEEFVVILPETALEEAIELAERIRMIIEEKEFKVSEKDTIHLTISIGIGSGSEGITAEHLIKAADTAVYDAKEHGRNQVRYSNI
jgi:diguanylate cyclase (GGDEF)-like protein/PAS domain S-box-containing protein